MRAVKNRIGSFMKTGVEPVFKYMRAADGVGESMLRPSSQAEYES